MNPGDPTGGGGVLHAALVISLLLLVVCATGPAANPRDPLEPFNRGVFQMQIERHTEDFGQALTRDAFLQARRNLVYDGNPPDDDESAAADKRRAVDQLYLNKNK